MSVRRPRQLPLVAFAAALLLAVHSLLAAFVFLRHQGDDFRRFYASAKYWQNGGDPYAVVLADTPNLNHPLLLPVFWLFTFGSERSGYAAWSITSLALFILCLPVIGRHANIAPLDAGIMILTVSGTFLVLAFGQVSFLLMGLFTAAWSADRSGRTRRAGALLGLLSALKPFFGLYALYLLWRREWRALVAFGIVLVLAALCGLAVVGVSGFLEWIHRLEEVRWRWHVYNGSAWGVSDRLFTVQPFFRATSWTPLLVSPVLARVLTAAILSGVAGVLWRAASKTDFNRSYALLGLAAILMSPLGWLYYLPTFAGPVIAVLGRRPSWWLWPAAAMAAFPIFMFGGRSYGTLGTLFLGQWAFGTVATLFLLVAASPEEQAERIALEEQSAR